MSKFKNPILFGAVLFISVLAYSAIIFIAIENRTSQFWIAYLFTLVAFLLQIPAFLISFGKGQSLKKIFLGLPIDALSSIYLFIQIILSLVIAFAPSFNIKIAAVLSILLLAVYLILLIITFMTKEVIEKVEDKVASKTSFIKALVVEVEIIENNTEDSILKKKLRELEDTIKYSDPMSHESLGILENKIESKVVELSDLILDHQHDDASMMIDTITGLFIERNKKTKALK